MARKRRKPCSRPCRPMRGCSTTPRRRKSRRIRSASPVPSRVVGDGPACPQEGRPSRRPMQSHPEQPGAEPPPHHIAQPASPRSDFIAALLWIAFGIIVAIASWRMDRLENQDINPYTVPGLLPGLLGIALIFFGVLLLLRAWRQGALDAKVPRGVPMSAAERKRLLIVLGLCLTSG